MQVPPAEVHIATGDERAIPSTVLLTGDRGLVGRWLRRSLERSGYRVVGFDLRDGFDIADADQVRAAASRASVTIHAAVEPLSPALSTADAFRVNVEGSRNVLGAAEQAGHRRVIVFSSAQVFGVFDGEREPRSFPIRDSTPRLATGPYGASKVAMEDLCESFVERTGVPTLCFRPVHVWVPGQAADTLRRWRKEPKREFTPHWNFGAFVDVRDVVSAVHLGLEVPTAGHHRLLLCAGDLAAMRSTREMAARHYPTVPWEPGWPPDGSEWPALFDCDPAKELLGWRPVHGWREDSRESTLQRAWRRLRHPAPRSK